MQRLEIPQDILDIIHKTQYEHDEYCEFGIDITVDREGDIKVRDMMGIWTDKYHAEDLAPAKAWDLIRKWWRDEEDNLLHQKMKRDIEKQIDTLQGELKALENTAKKKKWFW